MLKKLLTISLLCSGLYAQDTKKLYDQVKPLSPEEALKTIQVPKGYKLQVVASEPMISEPVDCVWDANGDMYVIEMKTYMQDADATGQFEKTSRVMKLTDTDGDGKMDKSSVFIDGLMLPRMILPLDDRILVCETNVVDIYSYRDTNGDGKADEKKIWYKGGKRGGNLEHQPSGLIWNIDNWIYMTKASERFRIVDGKVEKSTYGYLNGQWGLHHDDDGNFAVGFSGAEKSFEYFQNPIIYGASKFPNELEKDFNTVWPIDNIPDTQGGVRRLRKDNTLNHMTAACGHTVYRGELMPEFYGNYLVAEPVGRLIRMAKVDTSLGFKQMRNVAPNSEFIRSTDANFRPVNLKTGPEGALYIVDMYRGIIQEGNWTKKGAYLRGVIDKYGMAKTIQNGRIYRLVPEDYAAKNTRPEMLSKSSPEIIKFLGHTNGWMRSTARKLLILRNDKSIIPQLKSALQTSQNTQEKIELLWTLDGLQALDASYILEQLKSNDSRYVVHVLRTADPLLQAGSPQVLAAYKDIFQNSKSSPVLSQAFLSTKKYAQHNLGPDIQKLQASHKEDSELKHHFAQWEREKEAYRKHREKMDALKGKGPLFKRIMAKGEKHYKSLCFACHGANGEGTPMAGTNTTLAPSLKASPRVLGDQKTLLKIALHGLAGPIDGKTYPGAMESLASHDNKYLLEVLTYIRNSWGNSAEMIDERKIKHVRHDYRKRKTPWTIEELSKK
jgi:glucose/arabinose dehydrogenase/mono/diheme cytochrome c family protein